ncbi:MAG: hypothetical protein ACK4VJ_01530 [Rhodoluna sp.]
MFQIIGVGVKSKLKIGALVVGLASLLALIVFNPWLLVLPIVGGVLFAGWSLWTNQGTSQSTTTKAQDTDFSDPYDSLEDDIRHHNYGYPGFGSDDEDEHHR